MSPTDSLYILMFMSGLLGGFGHCIGMCGPVVVAYSLHLRGGSFMPHLLYSFGRITTYSILGGVMGLTGSFVSAITLIEKFQAITLAAIGFVMIISGLAAAGWMPVLVRRKRGAAGVEKGGSILQLLNRIVNSIGQTRTTGAFFPMGLVLGFIPCGLLYTAFIAAAGAGVDAANHIRGFLRGALLLFLFGIGTAPALLFLGQVVAIKREWLRSRFYKASAIMMVAMGIIFVYRALK
jgi:sulfite exporter TauE/SafE